MIKDVYFQDKSFLALPRTFPTLRNWLQIATDHRSQITGHRSQVTDHRSQITGRADKTLSRYSTCLFHNQLTSVKAQKYWLPTNVLYFGVRFGADFFYNTNINNNNNINTNIE